MQRLHIILLAFLLTLSGMVSHAQTFPKNVPQLIATIDTFHSHTPAEKVHIQLDKPYYALGDTIWMKAYVVNAENNMPSLWSKVLYVDLIDDLDSVKTTLNLPVISGFAMGDFTLKASFIPGNYRIRAYTSLMRNVGDDFFFDKVIPIGDAASAVIAKTNYLFTKTGTTATATAGITYSDIAGLPLAGKNVNYTVQINTKTILEAKGITDEKGYLKISFPVSQRDSIKSGMINTSIRVDKQDIFKNIPLKFSADIADMQFFPESGQMVEGIRSRIAFKVLGPDGIGKDVSGYIIDKNNNKLTDFKTVHAGMGSFFLTPVAGTEYTAVVSTGDLEKVIRLPKAIPSGYVLYVAKTDSAKIYIEVAISKALLGSADTLTLIAQRNGVVEVSARIPMKKELIKLALSKAEMGTGILQLTLLSSSFEPLAERLLFIRKDDQIRMQAATNKPIYAPREKVSIDLQTSDHLKKPVNGSFSISVTSMDKVPVDEADETTIMSNLLLSSDLKGYIEKPNYYFIGTSPEKEIQLDNLMLSQGWRRFTWKEVLSPKPVNTVLKGGQGLPLNGTVTTFTGKPASKAKVTLFTDAGELFNTKTDDQGRFSFNNLNLSPGNSYKIIAETAKGDKEVNLHFDVSNPPVKHHQQAADEEINASFARYIESQTQQVEDMKKYDLPRGIALKEVVVKTSLTQQWIAKRDSIKKLALENSANLNGKGHASQVIIFADLQIGCPILSRCLSGMISGAIGNIDKSKGWAIFLDGRYIGKDPDEVVPASIASIEVLKGPQTIVYGFDHTDPMLLINTKRGGPDYNALIDEYKGIVAHNVPTKIDATPQYYIGRQFYSTDYTAHPDLQIPDQRTTVYWNADLITDEKGKKTIEFYNSDTPGTYRAVIEGLDASGNLGRKVFTYIVK